MRSVAKRALAMLNNGMCVTTEYVEAAIAAELVDAADVRGLRWSEVGRTYRRWYLA